MALTPGSRLGPYEIVAPIGAGGMGEVFRARDTRLDRSVAIKILPPAFATDPQLKTRFEREAKTISQLNHPNICTLYDVGSESGTEYLVMELVDGESLASRLGRGPLPLAEVIRYGAQVADALDRAHRAGVVHRDLKPGNVMITKSGAKLLDFGLARPSKARRTQHDAPTQQVHDAITERGMIVGTLPYMPPEQLQGEDPDPRGDIFALGAVLYEMITGRRAFDAPSSVTLIAQILEHEPPAPRSLQANTPALLEHIVMTCVAKDPDLRFQCAADIARELRFVTERSSAETVVATPLPVRRRPLAAAALILCGLIAAAAVAVATYRYGRASTARPSLEFTQLTFDGGEETHPALSPDGKMLAYVRSVDGQRDIFLQRVDGRSAINLTKDSPADDVEPAFSPDGSQIAFRSDRDGGGIFVMGATGESARRLTQSGYNPSWSPDGKQIVYATEQTDDPRIRFAESSLYVVDAVSSATRLLYKGDAIQPKWSPHGDRIAFWTWGARTAGVRDIATIGRDGKDVVFAVTSPAVDWDPAWSADGKWLYFSTDLGGTMNVWRIAIDEKSGRTDGPAEPVSAPAAASGFISTARNGDRIVYQSTYYAGELLRVDLDPVTEKLTVREEPIMRGTTPVRYLAPSPDGRQIVYATGGNREDLFVMDADGTNLRQLTNDPERDRGPGWFPDGSRIAFYSAHDGTWNAWSVRPDGSALTQFTARKGNVNFPRVSPDGKKLAFITDDIGGRIVPFDGQKEAAGEELPIPRTAEGDFFPRSWSPDSRLVNGGPWGVRGFGLYVYSVPERRLHDLGIRARTSAFVDDRRIVFIDADERIGIVDFETRQVRILGAFPPARGGQRARLSTLAISVGGRVLLAYRVIAESDVWMMTVRDSAEAASK